MTRVQCGGLQVTQPSIHPYTVSDKSFLLCIALRASGQVSSPSPMLRRVPGLPTSMERHSTFNWPRLELSLSLEELLQICVIHSFLCWFLHQCSNRASTEISETWTKINLCSFLGCLFQVVCHSNGELTSSPSSRSLKRFLQSLYPPHDVSHFVLSVWWWLGS